MCYYSSRAIYGHIDGTYDWYSIDDFVKEESARIIGKNTKYSNTNIFTNIQELNQLKRL